MKNEEFLPNENSSFIILHSSLKRFTFVRTYDISN